MSSQTVAVEQVDHRWGAQCPFCMTSVPAGAEICRGCGARKSFKVMQAPIARLVLWCTLFGSIWLVGGMAFVAPWIGQAESGFRQSSEMRCVQPVLVEYHPRPGYYPGGERVNLPVAHKQCPEIANLKQEIASAVASQRASHPGAV